METICGCASGYIYHMYNICLWSAADGLRALWVEKQRLAHLRVWRCVRVSAGASGGALMEVWRCVCVCVCVCVCAGAPELELVVLC